MQLGSLVALALPILLAGCASGPTVISESADKVQIAHDYPPPLKQIGTLAADRCAAYGRAPAFKSDSPYNDQTAVANFRCVPLQ